ncbi:MAG: hypothetical protein GY906_34885 [bacterium]|nr:hypothetical protein [bacterium]
MKDHAGEKHGRLSARHRFGTIHGSDPKLLRPYFLHHRELLGKLSQTAWQTIAEMADAATGGNEPVRPGMVSVNQIARSDLGLSPYIHALASRGVGRRTAAGCQCRVLGGCRATGITLRRSCGVSRRRRS